jgi:hypothetical protein
MYGSMFNHFVKQLDASDVYFADYLLLDKNWAHHRTRLYQVPCRKTGYIKMNISFENCN